MPAYWISHVEVTDPDSYKMYASGATAAIKAHSGKFLARGGRFVQLEGDEKDRHVVVEFPSLEVAEECYQSDAYQAALDHARGASVRDLLIVEGV